MASTVLKVKNYSVTTFPVLGSGRFGQVYEAVHDVTKVKAAAKHITLEDEDEGRRDEMRTMATKELRIVQNLSNHSNIVKLLEHVLDEKSCWIFMEFCDLKDLASYMTRRPNLEKARRVIIMSQIANAVSFMHHFRPPIVHRDIKPENILMKTENGQDVVKMSDFGLSKLVEKRLNVSFTQGKMMETACGSIYFMAPEFFAEDEGGLKYDEKVDVFACGLVFAVVLGYGPGDKDLLPMSVEAKKTGKEVHIGQEMITQKRNKGRLPVIVEQSSEDSDLTSTLKRIILDMTEFDSGERPAMSAVHRRLLPLCKERRRTPPRTGQLEESGHVIVAAIDFGTTYSGYAFSFVNDAEQIYMNTNWAQSRGFASYKTPTSVLVTSDGHFIAFGYEAEDKYANDVTSDVTTSNKLFRHFKMLLHKEKKLSSTTTLEAVDGQREPALKIFAHALSYLKGQLLEAVTQKGSMPRDDAIRWVITVPAIWSAESKDFMRQAACKAGLIQQKHSRKLLIALEPEAASLCCRRINIAGYERDVDLSMPAGTKYLVVDCGGGTVDITAHQIQPDGGIRELHSATGGDWGGTKVDENFVGLLRKVLGDRFVDEYQRKCPAQWLKFMTSFQVLKHPVGLHNCKPINISIDTNMAEKFREIMGRERKIKDAIKKSAHLGVSYSNGHIRINQDTAESLFLPVLDTIVDHIESLLTIPKIQPCGLFFLVGGFGESTILQETLKEKFASRVRILIPAEPQMAVIKGAVLFGHRPKEIASRVSRFTYGTSGINPADSRRDLFSTFVRKGEEVGDGETRTFVYLTENRHQSHADIPLYSMDRQPKAVDYVDGSDVMRLGKFTVDTPGEGEDRLIEVDVTFGNTELQIAARASGEPATANIDFMTS